MRSIECSEILIITVLQSGDVFNLYSKQTDYGGVLVSARKPIAVWGGCDCVDIPDNTAECDHIMEQVIITSIGLVYGSKFSRSSCDVYMCCMLRRWIFATDICCKT